MAWVSFDRKPQACALPRGTQPSGNANAVAGDFGSNESELWFVNTRFSCLCTRDVRYSFVPRWRPPFVTAIAPEDRCHLNGMCVAPSFDRKLQAFAPSGDHQVTSNTHASGLRSNEPNFFVTALGQTNTPGGWRENKSGGGVLMETASNEILLDGLSMPHSPRWYDERLWVLESGNGTFGRVDVRAGRYEPVASLPGFTRGIDFFGRYAFIGLSQVRESAIFSGIAIAERPVSERSCGVWVVDIVTGQTVAWLKFDDGVQEIFAVNVMANSRCPDVINDQPKVIADAFILPDESLTDVPDNIRYVTAPPVQNGGRA